MDEPSLVKLIVKASNQQYEDQTIDCQLDWTVRRLKEHLFDVYPSKPKPDDQKLIYSGQLLKDKLILKDILRHYEGVQSQTHTFHLVCTPKPRFPMPFGSFASNQKQPNQQNVGTSTATVNDGLRQRHNQRMTAGTTTTAASNQTTSTPISSMPVNNSIPMMSMMNNNCRTSSSSSSFNVNGGGNIPSFNPIGFQQFPLPNEYMLAQQVVMQNWMQQAYIQYMNQYMNLLSTGVRPETIFMQNQANSIPSTTTNISGLPPSLPSSIQMPYLPQNFPFTLMNTNTNIGTNLTGTTDNSTISPPPPESNTSATATAAVATVSVPPSPVQDQQQQQPQPQPPQQQQQNHPQPRFPNIMQDDFQENRDWLDVFYSISRLMVLLTLVYLYSSPIRCLLVFVIGMAIYLYHMAYFRMQGQQQQQQQQQDDNNNNGAQAQAAPRQAPQNGEQQQQQQELSSNLQQQNDNATPNGASIAQEATTLAEQENSTSETTTTIAAATSTVANERVGGVAPGDASVSNVAEDADGTSMIAFLKTFVVSFIVSLLPETPPV